MIHVGMTHDRNLNYTWKDQHAVKTTRLDHDLSIHRIPTVQKEAIRSFKSAQTTNTPSPYASNTYLPLLVPPGTEGKFSRANPLNPHMFGLWEETGAPGGNPRRHGENVQNPHRE